MMSVMLQPSLAEPLAELWAVLHRDAPITLVDCEVHYLTSIALALDDDLLSQLLLKKLRLAQVAQADSVTGSVVRMNSYVEFSLGDQQNLFCQLLHPSSSAMPSYGLSIAGRAGTGLIGLHAGQSIQWPGEDGRMCDLGIVQVANCPGLDRWLGVETGPAARADTRPLQLAALSWATAP